MTTTKRPRFRRHGGGARAALLGTLWTAWGVAGVPQTAEARRLAVRLQDPNRATAGPGGTPSQESDRNQVRFALVVGNNLGSKPERTLRYAESEVSRLAEILRGWGEFQSVEVLQGVDRASLERGLKTVHEALARARAAGKSTMFLFYYSGHGDNEALELGDSRFLLRDLRSHLENLPADLRLAFVDACQSGALTGVKGGRRAPAYQVRIGDPGAVKGMAIVTSSTANELSQESDDLAGSFFSHNIMSGLRGAADSSRDGRVTLSELYQYAFARTLANTAASLVGGQHPTYETKMAGAGEVVLTRTLPTDAQLTFPREKGATYSVFAGRNVTAEVQSDPSQDLYLALPAGEYRVVRRVLGSVTEKRLSLQGGSSTPVRPGVMVAIAMDERTQRKKGDDGAEAALTARADDGAGHSNNGGGPFRNVIGVHAGALSSAIEGTPDLVPTFGGSYLRVVAPWLALRLRGDLAGFSGTDLRHESSSYLRVAPAIDALFPVLAGRRVGLHAGATVGGAFVRQRFALASLSSTYGLGFTYGLAVSASAHLWRGLQLWLNLTGGGETGKYNSRPTHHASYAASLGAAWGF